MKDKEPKGSESYMGTSVPDNKKFVEISPPGLITDPSTDLDGSVERFDSTLRSDYHLTVQLRYHLSRRQVSLLLGVLTYQAVYYGVNFKSYVSLLHLNEILLGNKVKASQIKDRYERLSVELSQIVIRDLAGKDLFLGDLVRLSKTTMTLLLNSKGLMSKDTYRSRLAHWRPENHLRLKTVPVDVIIERSGNSIRYTSYCKGYGEGSGRARKGRTPTNSELDGEETREWILSEQLSAKEFAQEVFLLAHFEWLKRFGRD